MTIRKKMVRASGIKGLGTGVVAVAVAAMIGVTAPVSNASADTILLYDNWSGIGDSGITVDAGGESYSGYPIGPQAAQITDGTAAPYNVLAWCIDFTHNINVPGTYSDYTLVPLTIPGLAGSTLNSPQPLGLSTNQTLINEINYLMDLGNTLLGSASSTELNDIGSAIQIAIWSELYPDISYSGASTAVENNVSNYLLDATFYSGTQWSAEALISSYGEQQLAYGTDDLPTSATTAAVPEPATTVLLTGGLIALGAVRRRKRST
jgi:hypothetical protein